MIPLEDLISPVEERVPHPNLNCGGFDIDSETGERILLPDVDLMISKIKIIDTDYGVRVVPTIKNNCNETVSQLFIVFVRSSDPDHLGSMDIISDIPPHSEVTLGKGIGVPSGSSYTVVVDWDDRISEANEANNLCRLSTSGRCGT